MAEDRKLPSTAGANEIDAFVRAVERLPANRTPGSRGRLLFAMDVVVQRFDEHDLRTAIRRVYAQEADTAQGVIAEIGRAHV